MNKISINAKLVVETNKSNGDDWYPINMNIIKEVLENNPKIEVIINYLDSDIEPVVIIREVNNDN